MERECQLRGMFQRILRLACFLFCATPIDLLAQLDTASVTIVHSGCSTTLTLERIRTFALHSAVITSHDGEASTYEGAWLKDVLKADCPSIAAIEKRTMVNSYVRVEATDGYTALIALTEADSSFRERPVILAWKKNGALLDDHQGPFQLIVPDDLRHARDVRKVKVLEVRTP